MDSEKGNRVFARGAQCAPPLVFGAQKKPGLDRVKAGPPPPPEAILVIFGRRALNFFFV